MALSPSIGNRVISYEALPTKNPDSPAADVAIRGSDYGEAYGYAPLVGKYPLVLEGSYFVARTPTPGTGVSYFTNTTFDETKPLCYGNLAVNSTKRVWLDYAKVIVTTAGGAAVTSQWAVKTDTVNRTLSADHRTTATPYNPFNGSIVTFNYNNASTATVLNASSAGGAVVAEGANGGLDILGDVYYLEFGQKMQASGLGLTAAQATDPSFKVVSMPPVVVLPGGSFTIYLWMASNNSAMSYSLEVGWIER
jgi:hypothetical protein